MSVYELLAIASLILITQVYLSYITKVAQISYRKATYQEWNI